jgi:hypothetical protein
MQHAYCFSPRNSWSIVGSALIAAVWFHPARLLAANQENDAPDNKKCGERCDPIQTIHCVHMFMALYALFADLNALPWVLVAQYVT